VQPHGHRHLSILLKWAWQMSHQAVKMLTGMKPMRWWRTRLSLRRAVRTAHRVTPAVRTAVLQVPSQAPIRVPVIQVAVIVRRRIQVVHIVPVRTVRAVTAPAVAQFPVRIRAVPTAPAVTVRAAIQAQAVQYRVVLIVRAVIAVRAIRVHQVRIAHPVTARPAVQFPAAHTVPAAIQVRHIQARQVLYHPATVQARTAVPVIRVRVTVHQAVRYLPVIQVVPIAARPIQAVLTAVVHLRYRVAIVVVRKAVQVTAPVRIVRPVVLIVPAVTQVLRVQYRAAIVRPVIVHHLIRVRHIRVAVVQ